MLAKEKEFRAKYIEQVGIIDIEEKAKEVKK